MNVIHYTSYGDSTVLKLAQADKPSLKDNEILVKIQAVTVNPFDMKVRSGSMQKMVPVQLPYVPGSDLAGEVEDVGKSVTRLKAGDVVFGTTFGGSYAEYIAINEAQVAVKPANISVIESAALAVPLVTSYTVLIEAAQLKAGQRVLIHGASGGVGSTMLQMAKAAGAFVIATASGAGVSEVKALGADEAVDYKTQDFTQVAKDIDVVVDTVGGETQVKSFQVLKAGGKLISIVMPPSEDLAKKYNVSAQFVNSTPSFKKLEYGRQLVDEGKITPRVARTLKLEQAAEAQDLVSAGGINGKVVLEVG